MAVPVTESYARGVPLMLEGELGAGQVEIAKRLYLDGPLRSSPLFPSALDELTDARLAPCAQKLRIAAVPNGADPLH
ncbi:MAG: hypothetical protein ACLTXI_10615 [Collinsella sp.]